jgi:S-adenosylmethionine/arginine decarboxylase-like enzyme
VAAVRRRLPTGPVDVATGVRLSDATRDGAVVVVLRHDFEPEGLDGGVALLAEAFDEIHTFTAQGDGPLAQLLDLVLLADAVAAALVRRTGA